jgi:class 3 adenylate cyclase
MGSSQSRPFSDLSPEEISFAVANLGERYNGYCDAVIANGVDGSLLIALDESEIEETLDDLHITNRLHRRVLIRELNKAQSSNDFVSASYDYDPSTPASELEPYSQIAETCFQENRKSAVMAGVHLILNNGNQLSLDTKVLKNGQLQSKRLTICGRRSICSTVVDDGRDQDYYKIEVPLALKTLCENQSTMTYTGFVLKDESGKRVGVVCMVDRCHAFEVVDSDRKVFLRRMARDTEQQLKHRKQLLKKLETEKNERKNDVTIASNDTRIETLAAPPLRSSLDSGSQVPQRFENAGASNSAIAPNDASDSAVKSTVQATHKLPKFQKNMANEAERAHLPTNFYEMADHLLAPRPPIPKHDMERSAAVEALGMVDIGPEDEIVLHLENMVKMAKQVFGFPHGEITFQNHETQYSIARDCESDEIRTAHDTFFQPINCKNDGSRFICKMPRSAALCNYVIASGGTIVVQDLAMDETFRWLANISSVRCYVGSPIRDFSGQVVAVLCLFDTKPRPDFEAAHEVQIEHLTTLISQCIENWALARSIERLARERQEIEQARNKINPPKGKVTFVLTSIQGTSELWESSRTAMQQSLDIHNDIIRKLRGDHWGYELEYESGAFALVFHDPVDAFGFAVNAQLALVEADWPDPILRQPEAKEEGSAFRGLRVKMAIHHGMVDFIADEGEATDRVHQYKGQTWSLTKSLASMAQGGQILSTVETWEVAYYFMGSVLGYPQVLDHGCHVIQKGTSVRDGLITKRIIQVVPAKLAFDYFAARKRALVPAGKDVKGRQFPPLVSLKAVSASFHDAPFEGNEATIAFVNLAAINEQDVLFVTNLIGKILDGSPQFRGYQCQGEMMVFYRPVDAVLFGLHLKNELGKREGGTDLTQVVKYGCIHDVFQTMGPHRSTGRADYFGKIVNRAARLSSVTAPGSVWLGVFHCEDDSHRNTADPINNRNVKVRYMGIKTLKGIQEEISVYECDPHR